MPSSDAQPHPAAGRRFATTRWSVVLAAGRDSTPEARTALAALCETYWYPLYAYVRREGYTQADAQDLTQGFFARLLEKHDLQDVRPERGRFRSFLLASIKHFLINEWDRARAQKRGGGKSHLSLDFHRAEHRYQLEPADEKTPQALFDRQWALTLLDRVRETLRQEFTEAGKQEQFDKLQVHLTGEKASTTYAQAAQELGMSETAVKVAVHRLRQKFRQRLREEIAQTVSDADEIDEEIRDLFRALRG